MVDNERDGRWLLAGDNCYVYESFTGENDDGVFIPIGLAFGSMERCMMTMEEMWQYVGRRSPASSRSTSGASGRPSRAVEFDDTLHVAELSLAPGEPSRISG